MHRFFKLCLFALLLPCAAVGQTTFRITPNPSSVTELPDVFDATAYATITNISNVRDSIRWVRTEIYLPKGFTTAVCDCEQCYKDEISTMTFGIAPNESCEFDVHFYNHLESCESGLVHLKVSNVNVPNDTVTAVYIYNCATSGTHDPLPAAHVRLFPNPTTEGFVLENADEVAGIHLFSLSGGQVAYFEPSSNHRYSLAQQPVGTYIVALRAKNGKVFQAVELRKQ